MNSIAHKELPVYSKSAGACLTHVDVSNNVVTHKLEKAMEDYQIKDSDLHIGY